MRAIFRHKKTGLLHRVVRDDLLHAETTEPLVAYCSIHGGKVWVIEADKFEDRWEKER